MIRTSVMILMANISSETNGFISHTATIYRANNSTLFIKKIQFTEFLLI